MTWWQIVLMWQGGLCNVAFVWAIVALWSTRKAPDDYGYVPMRKDYFKQDDLTF